MRTKFEVTSFKRCQNEKSKSRSRRGVATGWTGVDMSTPRLPEVVPEIDANMVRFYGGGEKRSGLTLSLL